MWQIHGWGTHLSTNCTTQDVLSGHVLCDIQSLWMCRNSQVYQTAPSGPCWISSRIFTRLSVSRPLPFSLSDRNSPSVPQKFNNAAVIMYLFALFPWARWLLASLNIEQDNLWISISLCDRSLYKAIPSSVLTAPLIHFTFWSCTSSSAMCFVKMTASVGSHPPPKLYSPLWKF